MLTLSALGPNPLSFPTTGHKKHTLLHAVLLTGQSHEPCFAAIHIWLKPFSLFLYFVPSLDPSPSPSLRPSSPQRSPSLPLSTHMPELCLCLGPTPTDHSSRPSAVTIRKGYKKAFLAATPLRCIEEMRVATSHVELKDPPFPRAPSLPLRRGNPPLIPSMRMSKPFFA
jgi:hypothetical protein